MHSLSVSQDDKRVPTSTGVKAAFEVSSVHGEVCVCGGGGRGKDQAKTDYILPLELTAPHMSSLSHIFLEVPRLTNRKSATEFWDKKTDSLLLSMFLLCIDTMFVRGAFCECVYKRQFSFLLL